MSYTVAELDPLTEWLRIAKGKQVCSPSGLYTLDRTDCIRLFRAKELDIIERINSDHGPGVWRGFLVHQKFADKKQAIRELTQKVHKTMLDSSIG